MCVFYIPSSVSENSLCYVLTPVLIVPKLVRYYLPSFVTVGWIESQTSTLSAGTGLQSYWCKSPFCPLVTVYRLQIADRITCMWQGELGPHCFWAVSKKRHCIIPHKVWLLFKTPFFSLFPPGNHWECIMWLLHFLLWYVHIQDGILPQKDFCLEKLNAHVCLNE